jgi:hypothetical protein
MRGLLAERRLEKTLISCRPFHSAALLAEKIFGGGKLIGVHRFEN